MRFTKNNRQQVLDENEGFTRSTFYDARNFTESRTYTIKDGKLNVSSSGKTSWSDSRFSEEHVYTADDEETKRFLRKYKDELKLGDQ